MVRQARAGGSDLFLPLRSDAGAVSVRTFVSTPLSADGDRAICRADAFGDVAVIEVLRDSGRERHAIARDRCSCGAASCLGDELLCEARADGLRPFEPQAPAYTPINLDEQQGEWFAPYCLAPNLGPSRIHGLRTGRRRWVITEIGAVQRMLETEGRICSCGRDATCIHRELAAQLPG